MRARDVRAIAFWLITTVILFGGTLVLLHNIFVSLALTAAYNGWLLTRARMQRVFRRMRGVPDWSGYFDNSGTRLKSSPAPGTAPGSPRPVERP
jgi:hypothetical protein